MTDARPFPKWPLWVAGLILVGLLAGGPPAAATGAAAWLLIAGYRRPYRRPR